MKYKKSHAWYKKTLKKCIQFLTYFRFTPIHISRYVLTFEKKKWVRYLTDEYCTDLYLKK